MTKKQAIHKFIGSRVRFDEYGGGYIWGDHTQEGEQMIAQLTDRPREIGSDPKEAILTVRGWGAIQNLFRHPREAKEFQDELGKWIAEAINEKLERERKEVENGRS